MSTVPASAATAFPSTATATAHPNIALIKYWGKRDESLVLPAAGSLSLTLDVFPTTTTVTLSTDPADVVWHNGAVAGREFTRRVGGLLDTVRQRAHSDSHALVVTHNSVPTGAGLASSASGFAALAVAAAAAYGLELDTRQLSRLARRGSGSASRSLIDGLAVWHAGDDESSFAEPVAGPALGMIAVVIDDRRKAISSRDAMRLTAATSPYYDAWVAATAADLDAMLAALARDDFTAVGELTESNALRMHAAIAGSRPPVRYLTAASLTVFELVAQLRAEGLPVYATADAGPNVVVLCRQRDLDRAARALAARVPQFRLIPARPGRGAHLVAAEGAP